MQKEDIKSGFLQVPPSWLQHLLNKPWVKKQCVLYTDSHQGVKRLEVFDLAPSLRRKEPAGLIIPLTDCVKIAEEHHKGKDFVFSVVTREGSHMFAAVSIQELREWVDALQRIAFGETGGTDCPRPLGAAKSITPAQCDENALYGSTTAEHRSTYPVTVEENEATARLHLNGRHLVQIAPASVQLRTVSDGRLRVSWLFSHIRRYGLSRGSFAMEVGRSSETGPGSFVFRTSKAADLQRELQRVMAEYEQNRRSAAPDLPSSPPPPPPPPPPEPLETQTLNRLDSGRKAKKKTIAKPPRRTKPGAAAAAAAAEELPNVVPLAEKQWLLTQSLKMTSPEMESVRGNQALLGALSAPYLNEPDELMYAEPVERQEAWRELGRSVEHLEHMDSRRSAPSDPWEAAEAEVAAARADALRQVASAADGGGRASMSYACLQHIPRPTEPSGAQYARLRVDFGPGGAEERTATWAADQSRHQEATTASPVAAGEEAVTADGQPLYENLPTTPAGTQPQAASEIGPARRKAGSPMPHVLVNDAMYTLVDKPLKSGSS